MFSKEFMWGAATASYQIEGAPFEDGKTASVWDMYAHTEGKIYNGQTGDIGCDHYHRYKEDVALMKELGLKAYRLSISWPRIFPDASGKVNQKGIDFYNSLFDELIENDIVPYITLFHWDLPMWIHQRGGWLNRETASYFAEYAKTVVEHFSDRVKNYFTFNEPQCFIGLGYVEGIQAPGLKSSLKDSIVMSHHVMLAHGMAVKTMREFAASDIKIGYAPTCTYGYPETDSPEDREAARRFTFNMPEKDERWFWNVTWWSDPVILGKYPEDGLKKYAKYLPENWSDDMETISQPIDFYGQNLYNGCQIRACDGKDYEHVERYDGFPRTAIGWPITPEAIKWCIKFVYERYNLPVYITENGISCCDIISLDGKVHDPNRIDFLHRYLLQIKEAMDEGAEVLGYFQWSLMDNFEWANGYSERFGLVFVDYPTQKRMIKDSGYWYKEVIETNGDIL